MAHDENVMKDHDNEKHILTLTDATKTLISCAENIQEIAEHIIYSCDDIADTKRMDYVSIPHIRTNELKELATLYNLAAKRLNSAAKKLLEGDLRYDTLTEIIVYGLFLIEQMKSEEYRVHQVLNMLRESCQDSHNLMLNL